MGLCSQQNFWASAYFYNGEKEIKTPYQFELSAINPSTWGLSYHPGPKSVIDQIRTWAKKEDLIENGAEIIYNVEGHNKIIFAKVPKECKLINTNFKNNNKNNNSNKRVKNRENELNGLFNKNNKVSNREEELKNLFKGGKTRRSNKKSRKTRKNK